MTTQATTVEWGTAQDALRDMVGRLTAMLRTISDSSPRAVGQWNLAEVATHLSHAWVMVPALARGDLSRAYDILPGLSGTSDASLIRDVWDVGEVTRLAVASDPERDVRVLADHIDERAAEFFAESVGKSPDESRGWLVEGTTVARRVLTCHLLNETVVHGFDIARAAETAWTIEREHAAMVFGGFIVPVIQSLDPRALVDQQEAAGLRATYDLRLRGGTRFHFVFANGELHVEEPSGRRVDCHISADPTAMLLVACGRTSQWPAIAKGQIVAWGLRPWLGPRLRALMRNP